MLEQTDSSGVTRSTHEINPENTKNRSLAKIQVDVLT